MSDTPRTDAAIHRSKKHPYREQKERELHDFARQLERELNEALEKLDWQNMPNRREPTRGGYEFYINEEWTCIRDAALNDNVGCIASLMKVRFDPDDERVRIRRVLDDDAILQDLNEAQALNAEAITERELQSILMRFNIIDHDAIEDSEGYDGGETLANVGLVCAAINEAIKAKEAK